MHSRPGLDPRCANCGYSLAGLPGEATRCPECGRVILETDLTAILRANDARRSARILLAMAPLMGLIAAVLVHLLGGGTRIWVTALVLPSLFFATLVVLSSLTGSIERRLTHALWLAPLLALTTLAAWGIAAAVIAALLGAVFSFL